MNEKMEVVGAMLCHLAATMRALQQARVHVPIVSRGGTLDGFYHFTVEEVAQASEGLWPGAKYRNRVRYWNRVRKETTSARASTRKKRGSTSGQRGQA